MTDQQTTYLSKAAHEELIKELEHRVKVLRPEIAGKISEAREMGDLSENFAYHEAREQQGLNESRVSSIQEMLLNTVIVEESLGGSIQLGSTFGVRVGGTEKSFSIVGASEANPMEGKISNASPLGLAFLGHVQGDTVEVDVPSGKITYEIISIK